MCLLFRGALAADSFNLPESEDFIYPGEEIVDVVIGPALEMKLERHSRFYLARVGTVLRPHAGSPLEAQGKMKPSGPSSA